MHAFIIGAGGVGSWLCPSLCLLIGPKNVTVIDGDTLEQKNLNRQLFTRRQVGQNKASALARRYKCHAVPGWFNAGSIRPHDRDWLFVCVDNNPARSAALQACDMADCRAIVAANEITSSEAYVYCRDWQGSRLDPRTYYPEIATDQTRDPQAAAIGCTGEAQEQNRQLVSANFSAAALAQNLFVCWEIEGKDRNGRVFQFFPHRLISNLTLTRADLCGPMQGLRPLAQPQPPAIHQWAELAQPQPERNLARQYQEALDRETRDVELIRDLAALDEP